MALPQRALAPPTERTLGRVALPAALALAAACAVAWRLPFAGLPITTDEAGYSTVARLWAHGERLYRAIWVDRPQGLLLVFRGLLHVDGGSPAALRGAAVVAGVLLVLLLAAVAYELGGPRRAALVALLAGAFGCSPFLESFTLSGELLSALPAVAAAWCFLRWRGGGRLGWIAAAGLLVGIAVMVKQSAFDTGVAAALLLALERPAGWRRALGLLVGAALVPVAAAVAAAPGAGDWWFAVVTYRFRGDSLATGSAGVRWGQLTASVGGFLAGLAPLLVLGGLGVASAPRFVRLWLVVAIVAALGGGQFHAHYWIQLVPPLSLAAASGVDRMLAARRARLELAIAVAAAVAAVAAVLLAAGASQADQTRLFFPGDPHLVHDATVARTAERLSPPGSAILVVPPTASIYYLAHRTPAVPYLWVRNVQTIAAGAAAQRRVLAAGVPALVVVEGDLRDLGRVGLVPAELARHYRQVAAAGDALFYARR